MKFIVSKGFQGSAEERNALIPQEQAHIKTLREKGIVEALYISADRPYVWIVMQGDSKECQVPETLHTKIRVNKGESVTDVPRRTDWESDSPDSHEAALGCKS
jgi:hypothetical protein